MTRQRRRSVRVYARITPELYTLFQQVRIAKRYESDADLMRAALRAYLQKQSDQVASKRYFNVSMQRRLSQVDWHLTVITTLLAHALAMLISSVSGQKLSPEKLLDQSIRLAAEKHSGLTKQLEASQPDEEKSELIE
ncbi:MAG: hypothetical protein CL607_21510 [Anaerolineaceae bacterium]|nr:hypothetical protein [Anaerolineaceae bacterium]MCA9891461.1 hypothetical protein [Anaerolineae bacterium]